MESVEPPVASHTGGTTLVVLLADVQSFRLTSARCHFGDTSSTGPTASAVSVNTINLSVACIAPASTVGVQQFYITVEGEQPTQTYALPRVANPVITELQPSLGALSQPITVVGTDLSDYPSLTCRATCAQGSSSISSEAVFVTETEAICRFQGAQHCTNPTFISLSSDSQVFSAPVEFQVVDTRYATALCDLGDWGTLTLTQGGDTTGVRVEGALSHFTIPTTSDTTISFHTRAVSSIQPDGCVTELMGGELTVEGRFVQEYAFQGSIQHNLQVEFEDTTISLWGDNSILGRSMLFSSTLAPLACCTIRSTASTAASAVLNTGTIGFKRVSASDITVMSLHLNLNSGRYQLQITSEAPTIENGICSSTETPYQPFGVLALPEQSAITVGQSRVITTVEDEHIQLSGPYSVLDRGIVVRDFTGTVVDCGVIRQAPSAEVECITKGVGDPCDDHISWTSGETCVRQQGGTTVLCQSAAVEECRASAAYDLCGKPTGGFACVPVPEEGGVLVCSALGTSAAACQGKHEREDCLHVSKTGDPQCSWGNGVLLCIDPSTLVTCENKIAGDDCDDMDVNTPNEQCTSWHSGLLVCIDASPVAGCAEKTFAGEPCNDGLTATSEAGTCFNYLGGLYCSATTLESTSGTIIVESSGSPNVGALAAALGRVAGVPVKDIQLVNPVEIVPVSATQWVPLWSMEWTVNSVTAARASEVIDALSAEVVNDVPSALAEVGILKVVSESPCQGKEPGYGCSDGDASTSTETCVSTGTRPVTLNCVARTPLIPTNTTGNNGTSGGSGTPNNGQGTNGPATSVVVPPGKDSSSEGGDEGDNNTSLVVGIVLGCMFAVVLICLVVGCVIYKKKRNEEFDDDLMAAACPIPPTIPNYGINKMDGQPTLASTPQVFGAYVQDSFTREDAYQWNRGATQQRGIGGPGGGSAAVYDGTSSASLDSDSSDDAFSFIPAFGRVMRGGGRNNRQHMAPHGGGQTLPYPTPQHNPHYPTIRRWDDSAPPPPPPPPPRPPVPIFKTQASSRSSSAGGYATPQHWSQAPDSVRRPAVPQTTPTDYPQGLWLSATYDADAETGPSTPHQLFGQGYPEVTINARPATPTRPYPRSPKSPQQSQPQYNSIYDLDTLDIDALLWATPTSRAGSVCGSNINSRSPGRLPPPTPPSHASW